MKILLTYKGRGKDVGRSVGRSVGFPDWFGKIEVWFCPILNIVTRFNNVYVINIDIETSTCDDIDIDIDIEYCAKV
jgi:uncharacterized membrane protein YhdT